MFYRLTWVFAKAANKDLPPLEIWLENLDVQPFDFVYDSINVIMDMLYSSIQTTVKKVDKPYVGNSETSTEILINRAMSRGITIQDLEKMDIGMIIDYLITCQNEDIEAEENKGKRYATQADIDNF